MERWTASCNFHGHVAKLGEGPATIGTHGVTVGDHVGFAHHAVAGLAVAAERYASVVEDALHGLA